MFFLEFFIHPPPPLAKLRSMNLFSYIKPFLRQLLFCLFPKKQRGVVASQDDTDLLFTGESDLKRLD
jgi:hypothetical protein